MNRLFFSLIALCLVLAGCATHRQTTTARTSIEEALVTQSAERAIVQFENARAPEKYHKLFLDPASFESYDQKFILSALKLALLKTGAAVIDKVEESDAIVEPRSAIVATEESNYFIGIPSIPIIIPGAGTIQTPEFALFKRDIQRARAKIGVYGIDRADRTLAFDHGTKKGTAYYTRWTFLIVLHFKTTDLTSPFQPTKKYKPPKE